MGKRLNKLNIKPEVAGRLKEFIESDLGAVRSGIAKSQYWQHFSPRLHANVSARSVEVSGESGFYVPPRASILERGVRKVLRGTRDPGKAAKWVGKRFASWFEVPKLLSYSNAFDAVMSHADVSSPILSRFSTNHIKLARHPKVFTSADSVRRHYRTWSGYDVSPNIIQHYYYQNILRGFMGGERIRTVLEIGAGNGNFPSILHHDWSPVRIILIDLPETLAVSISYLSSLFPDSRICMPHEIQRTGIPDEFDFAFLTVDQLDLVEDGSVDLAINCHSFQEMTQEQIGVYFQFVQRVCRDSGFLFVANRVEKIPCGPDAFSAEQRDPPNRMAEYPWNQYNEVLVHEISKLSRLVQLDGIAIRLERIQKGKPAPRLGSE